MWVKNGTNRTFTATRTAGRPSSATSSATRRASAATCSSSAARSVRSRWNVVSRLRDFGTHGADVTSLPATPNASIRYHGPMRRAEAGGQRGGVGPGQLDHGRDAHAGQLGGRPRPMPHSASGGRSPMTSTQLCLVSRYMPAGLANPVAILARSRLSPMPTEQARPVASRTARWTSAASASGSPVSAPRKASSQPSTSTTAGSAGQRGHDPSDTAS